MGICCFCCFRLFVPSNLARARFGGQVAAVVVVGTAQQKLSRALRPQDADVHGKADKHAIDTHDTREHLL